MKKALMVILGFTAVTITLTWAWTEGGRQLYGQFLKIFAPPIYDLLGFEGARVGALRERYINWIPFVGLVVATPGILPRRRLLGLLGGLCVLSVGHLALNLTEAGSRSRHLPLVPSMVSDALPFVLWIVVAYPVVSGWFAGALTPAVPSVSPEGKSSNGSDDGPTDATTPPAD